MIVSILLTVTFFCSIDLNYIHTFFSTKTAPQFVCSTFRGSDEDETKFEVVFKNQLSFSRGIRGEVKEWVGANINRWRMKNLEWFRIELIPDEFLPKEVLEAEGGSNKRRRKSNLSLREVIGGDVDIGGGGGAGAEIEQQIIKSVSLFDTGLDREVIEAWKKIAGKVYEMRSKNFKSNYNHVKRIFKENEEVVAPLLLLCPEFLIILAHILEDKFGFSVKNVDYKKVSERSERCCSSRKVQLHVNLKVKQPIQSTRLALGSREKEN